eukprot:COSAG05_NODE_4063_length_1691_cov_1.011307_1_plen_274_part_00
MTEVPVGAAGAGGGEGEAHPNPRLHHFRGQGGGGGGGKGGGGGAVEKAPSGGAVVMKSEKLDTAVAFPPHCLDLSPFTSPVLKRNNNGQIPPPTPPAAAAVAAAAVNDPAAGASVAGEVAATLLSSPTSCEDGNAAAGVAIGQAKGALANGAATGDSEETGSGGGNGPGVNSSDKEKVSEKKMQEGRPPKRLSRLLQSDYTLQAVVVHFGTLDRGHYIAYVRCMAAAEAGGGLGEAAGDIWFKCDDSTVTKVSEQEVLNSEAYLLFYVRERSD